MMKNRILFLILFVVFLFVNCKNTQDTSFGNNFLNDKIKEIESLDVRNPPASIWEYAYDGKTVYYIPPYFADQYGELYDLEGNFICYPDGGLSGRGDGRCNDFFTNSKKIKLIWEDKRTK